MGSKAGKARHVRRGTSHFERAATAAQRRRPPKAAAKSAHDRTRTCTPFPTLVPQTSLSTNSSTWASVYITKN
jgi:hypothetical protein